MKQFFMFFAAFLAAIIGLSAQEPASNGMGENQITAISVSGLSRTKPYIIERPLQKFIGRPAGDVDINEVIALVKSTGVVEPLSVGMPDNQEGSGKTLVITAREKWSILPIPVVSVNSSGWTVGAAVMDTNAFGIKDNMMVMGSYGTGGWMGNLMYISTPKGIGDFGWNFSGMVSLQNKEIIDQKDEQVLRRYDSIFINPSIGLSYQLTELITPAISVAYKGVLLRDSDDPVNAPEEDAHGISVSPGISIRHNTWDGIFLNEGSASLRYNYTFVIGGDDVHSVTLRAALNRSIIPGFRYIAKTGILFATPSAAPFFESAPISIGVNVLPQKYSAINFASGSLGLEKYLLKFSFGTISLTAAYEAVYSDGALLKHQFDHGPIAMLQMYFNKIAIPGMGLGGAYNVDKNVWQFAFNIGMAF
jgi:hypothetical protein